MQINKYIYSSYYEVVINNVRNKGTSYYEEEIFLLPHCETARVISQVDGLVGVYAEEVVGIRAQTLPHPST